MVAYCLVNMVGRASAANILGITVRELDKLCEIYELSEKLTNLPDPGTSITWAREIRNLNKRFLTSTVLDTIVHRVNNQEITNSKDIRKLRNILRDPVAREDFLNDSGSIQAALSKLGPAPSKKGHGLLGDIEDLSEAIRRYPWTTLDSLKGDRQVIAKLEEAEKLLKNLKKALSR